MRHRYLLVESDCSRPNKIVSVNFVLLLLIGFSFRDADLPPPYNTNGFPKFQDFRENVLKGSERRFFRTVESLA
jgi:hypothetical protein